MDSVLQEQLKKQNMIQQIRNNKAKAIERKSMAVNMGMQFQTKQPDLKDEERPLPKEPKTHQVFQTMNHSANNEPSFMALNQSSIRENEQQYSTFDINVTQPVRKHMSQAFMPVTSPRIQAGGSLLKKHERPSVKSQQENIAFEASARSSSLLKPPRDGDNSNEYFSLSKRRVEFSSEDLASQQNSMANEAPRLIHWQNQQQATPPQENFQVEQTPTLFQSVRKKMTSLFLRDIPLPTTPEEDIKNEVSTIQEAQRKERVMKSVVDKFLATKKRKVEITYAHASNHYQQIDIMKIDNLKRDSSASAKRTSFVQALNLQRQSFAIPSDHPAKLAWNFLVILLASIDGVFIPMSLAFNEAHEPFGLELAIYAIFIIDIILSFRTSRFDSETGELIRNPDVIRKTYIFSLGFVIDFIVAVPLSAVPFLRDLSFNVRILRLLKLFQLQASLGFKASSEAFKISIQIAKLFFLLLFYLHLTACSLFYVVDKDRQWVPAQAKFQNGEEDFYQSDIFTQYLTSLHAAILILMGNEINPESNLHMAIVCCFSICGALIIANIVGTMTVVVSALNRKAQKFQDKIDMANTSMTNIKLPSSIQEDIREFMLQTQNNLDTQKELDSFMQMISPSLRNKVTKHIFLNAIASNPILQSSQEAIDFLINDVSTLLFMPEDRIISQGEHGSSLYLIAQGDCQVYVTDHMKKQHYVRQLNQGEHFGEVSILFETPRTATVKSSNYCTLACLSKKTFYELCYSFPEIIVRMRERALEYNDPWKQFRKKVVERVDYFKQAGESKPFFLDEVQYHLREENFDKGSEIVGPDCPLKQIMFITSGLAELVVFDKEGYEVKLDHLEQGDIVGQYSVLYDESPIFSIVAKTRVRVLTLSQDFFLANKDYIDGLKMAIFSCEDTVEENGVPLCDYSRFYPDDKLIDRLKRANRRASILENSLGISGLLTKKMSKKSMESSPSRGPSQRAMHPVQKQGSKVGSILTRRKSIMLAKKKSVMIDSSPIVGIQNQPKRRNTIFERMAEPGSFRQGLSQKDTKGILGMVPEISLSSAIGASSSSSGSSSSESLSQSEQKRSSSSSSGTPSKKSTRKPYTTTLVHKSKQRAKEDEKSDQSDKSEEEEDYKAKLMLKQPSCRLQQDLELYVCSEKSEEDNSYLGSSTKRIATEPSKHIRMRKKKQDGLSTSNARDDSYGKSPDYNLKAAPNKHGASPSISSVGRHSLGVKELSEARMRASRMSKIS